MLNRTDFASDEEWWVYNWLIEAQEYNLLGEITYQPGPFVLSERAGMTIQKQLKTKTKTVDKFLFHPHVYTPDFSFFLKSGVLEKYFKLPQRDCVVVDVKGAFNPYGDPKQFSINCKWMWAKYEVFVEKIIPEKLFKKTWVPETCRVSPKLKKNVKKYLKTPVIADWVKRQGGK